MPPDQTDPRHRHGHHCNPHPWHTAGPAPAPTEVLRTPAAELITQVRAGLPYAALETLRERLGLSLPDLATVTGIPLRTLSRRRQTGRLDRLESERVLRIERLLALATEMLRDGERAREWLRAPKSALAGQSPLEVADTEVGAREVEQLIGRLRHGVFA